MFLEKYKIENDVQINTEAGGNATPYPDEASSPSLLIRYKPAKNDICVRKLLQCQWQTYFIKSITLVVDFKVLFPDMEAVIFLFSIMSSRTTLTACAATVAAVYFYIISSPGLHIRLTIPDCRLQE